MNKFFKSLALIAVAAFSFASCEDVPSPFDLPTDNGGSTDNIVVEPKGDGTAANPFNVKGLTEWITANEDIAKGKEVYVEGIVSSIKSLNVPQYTRAQYYINDTESTTGQFYVYNGLYLNGANFTANDQLKVGDKVLIKGTIDQYNGAFQIGQNSQILKLNEQGEGGGNNDDNATVGTKEAPISVADAKTSAGKMGYVTGYIVGYVDGQKLEENATFGAASASETEVLLADAADCTDATLCFPVQLPAGDIRTALNPNIASNIGKKATVYGSIEQYFGTTGMKSTSFAILDGKEIGTDPDAVIEYNAKGTGTEKDPFNVDGVIKYTAALAKDAKSTDDIWFKGTVESFKSGEEPGNSYGNATFYITDKDTENKFYCFRVMAGPNKAKFTSADQLKVGDEVVICGKVTNYMGNTPETVSGEAYVVTVNGKSLTDDTAGGDKGEGDKGEGDKGEGDQTTGDGMTINDLPSNITTNAYGTQLAADESTWLTWTWNGIEFAGARICKANAIDGTIQFQGDDANTAKQGFLFNKTAWTKNISKITLVLKVKESTTGTTYDPSYSLYAGSAAHPTESAITPTSSMTTADGIRTYTQVFDLSSANAKYFTIHNNKKGALYVEKIIVE